LIEETTQSIDQEKAKLFDYCRLDPLMNESTIETEKNQEDDLGF